MAYSEKKQEYNLKYAKEHYKRIPLNVTLEKYEEIRSHAETRSESVNGFIKRAIDETIQRDQE